MTIPYAKKNLIFDEHHVLSRRKPQPGEAPNDWMLDSWRREMPQEEQVEYSVSIGIIGLDLFKTKPRFSLVFDNELLRDGYTNSARLDALTHGLKKEIIRMRNEQVLTISTTTALLCLSPYLCALHTFGYTAKELQKLVLGTLRVSITEEELLDSIYDSSYKNRSIVNQGLDTLPSIVGRPTLLVPCREFNINIDIPESSSNKHLIWEEQYSFSNEEPQAGEAPRACWPKYLLEQMPEEIQAEYNILLNIVGIDLFNHSPEANPVFSSELLRDGYTNNARLNDLAAALKKEILQMQNEPVLPISTNKALELLRPDLLALQELGYTIDELHRLVRGSLRISITCEELLDAIYK